MEMKQQQYERISEAIQIMPQIDFASQPIEVLHSSSAGEFAGKYTVSSTRKSDQLLSTKNQLSSIATSEQVALATTQEAAHDSGISMDTGLLQEEEEDHTAAHEPQAMEKSNETTQLSRSMGTITIADPVNDDTTHAMTSVQEHQQASAEDVPHSNTADPVQQQAPIGDVAQIPTDEHVEQQVLPVHESDEYSEDLVTFKETVTQPLQPSLLQNPGSKKQQVMSQKTENATATRSSPRLKNKLKKQKPAIKMAQEVLARK